MYLSTWQQVVAHRAAWIKLVAVATQMIWQVVFLAYAQLDSSRNDLLAGATLHAVSMPCATHECHCSATKT